MSGGNHNRAFLAKLSEQNAETISKKTAKDLSEGSDIFYFQYNPKEAKVSFLEPAVQAALKGDKPATTETAGRGCMVRYVKKRK